MAHLKGLTSDVEAGVASRVSRRPEEVISYFFLKTKRDVFLPRVVAFCGPGSRITIAQKKVEGNNHSSLETLGK